MNHPHFQGGADGWDSRKKDPIYWKVRKNRLIAVLGKDCRDKLLQSMKDADISVGDLGSLGTEACIIPYNKWVVFCKSIYPWMDEAFK